MSHDRLMLGSMAPLMAVVSTYIGGIIAYLATVGGTCTGGSAGQLGLILYAIPLYIAALVFLSFCLSIRSAILTCLTVLPAVLPQAVFTSETAIRILAFGESACGVLQGVPYDKDGRESIFVTLWLIPGVGTPLAMTVLLWRRITLAPPTSVR